MSHTRAHRVEALSAALSHEPRSWSRAELERSWSRGTLQQALRAGLAVRVAPGLYCAPERASQPALLLHTAARWAGPHSTVTGLAALNRWGLAGHPTGIVDVQVPRRVYRVPPEWIRLHRSDVQVPGFIVESMQIASPEYAAIRAWATALPRDRTGLMLDAMRELSIAPRRIGAAAKRLPRVPDRRRLTRLLELAADGITSYLEHAARTTVFVGPRWRDVTWQAALRIGGRRFTIDMLHEAARVAVEFDGARYHSNDAARRRDLERDAVLASAGYVTIRLTYEDIMARPRRSREMVWRAVQARLTT